MTTKPDDRRWVDSRGNEIDEEDRGLVYDLETLRTRRGALGLLGGIGLTGLLAACGGGDRPSGRGTARSSAGTSTPSAGADGLTEVPDETGGPFPADGSNGPDVLDDSGIVRRDITSSLGSSTTAAAGVPLTVELTLRDAATGDAKAGSAVYLWHCDRDGRYSLYSDGVENENYLRGIQEAGDAGTVRFTSIFPACYQGRWPHIHFEVYESVANATASGRIVKTSQIALPKEACEAVYATEGYEQSIRNMSSTSLARDNVFGDDGGIHQVATMSGDVDSGYTAALTIGV